MTMSLNADRAVLAFGEAYTTERVFNAAIDPNAMAREVGSWHGAYPSVRSIEFTVNTRIENLGVYVKQGIVEHQRHQWFEYTRAICRPQLLNSPPSWGQYRL